MKWNQAVVAPDQTTPMEKRTVAAGARLRCDSWRPLPFLSQQNCPCFLWQHVFMMESERRPCRGPRRMPRAASLSPECEPETRPRETYQWKPTQAHTLTTSDDRINGVHFELLTSCGKHKSVYGSCLRAPRTAHIFSFLNSPPLPASVCPSRQGLVPGIGLLSCCLGWSPQSPSPSLPFQEPQAPLSLGSWSTGLRGLAPAGLPEPS